MNNMKNNGKLEFYVGTECGNGFVKSCSNVKEYGKVDIYLNTLKTVEKSDYEKSQLGSGYNKDEVYSIDGKYYIVGKKPNKDEDTLDNSDKSRYFSDKFKVALLISIYRQIKDVPNHSSYNTYVVTGLPTEHSEDEGLKEEIEKFYKKTHTINNSTIRISGLEAIAQGEAAFYSELYNNGEESEDYILETTPDIEDMEFNTLYIDLGHVTTDFRRIRDYSVVDGSQMYGMQRTWKQLIKIAKEQNSGLAKHPALTLEEQLRKSGFIDIQKETANVSKERDILLKEYAKEIIGKISQAFNDIYFDSIRFCGGGSILMKDYLLAEIKEKHKTNLRHIERYKFLDNPQERNSLGYLEACYQIYND